MDWKTLLACLTGSVDEELLLRNEYLVEENRILRQQVEGCVLLNDAQRQTLAEIGKKLSKQALEEVATIVGPKTILAWHRKLVKQKFDGSAQRKSLNDPVSIRSLKTGWLKWSKVKGMWRYLYRAVDKYGKTIDFLLTKQRDKEAARRFLNKAIGRHGVPEKIAIDGSDVNAAAIQSYNEDHDTFIEIRQVKYLNNIVEQDHRGVKRITRPMMGFKSFEAAQATLTGIELMQMLRKGQREGEEMTGLSVAEQFYKLAA